MKLSRQLFLLSLLTLALPWAGCQYLQEMDATLRKGQAKALEATSKAVAARLSSDPELSTRLSARQGETNSLYAHNLSHTIIVDGYGDDWSQDNIDARVYTEGEFKVSIKVGLRRKAAPNFAHRQLQKIDQDQLYIFIQVQDSHIQYHHPGRAGLINGDHLGLTLGDRRYAVGTSSPGKVKTVYQDHNQARIEHRIFGVWQETALGYQVELSLPLSLSQQGLGVSVVNSQPNHVLQQLGNQTLDSTAAPLMFKDAKLNQAITIFAMDGIQLSLSNSNHWLIGQTKTDTLQPQRQTVSPLAQWLYQALSGAQQFPRFDNNAKQGRLNGPETLRAASGHSNTHWYQHGQHLIARTAVPIIANQRLLAVVVAQQNNDTRISLLNSAFSRLLLYSIACSLIAGVGLLAYASWLSWRIRKLSQAADLALDDQGQINPRLPASRAKDEIGDLSRSYSRLLERLQGYTEYLQTLASKLSHELRTPLAIAKGSLDNLQQEPLSPAARVYAERAQEGCNRLSTILNAMSAATRVESAIRSAETETFQLDRLVQEVAAAYQSTFDQANIQLRCLCQGQIVGAPELLVQLLDKLVDNAVDFCPEGGLIEIALSASHSHFCLSVSNDGPLLPSNMQHRLFDSMVSVRQQSNNNGHLGLGLYIARLIADYHNAQLRAENRSDGSGVIFSLLLAKRT